MSSATLTLYGCYNFNRSLFDEMVLPEGVEKNLLIDSIIMRGGEYEVLYPNPDMLKGLIGSWSRQWYSVFSNWERATKGMDEIRPLDNYDRNEEWTDNGNVKRTSNESNTTHSTSSDIMNGNGSTSGHDNSSGSGNVTDTSKISADDMDNFVNRTQDTQSNTTNTSADSSTTSQTNTQSNAETNGTAVGNASSEDINTSSHTGHIWGNIGVTTSSTMFKEFYDVMRQYGNIYDSIATVFLQAFVIPIL